MPKFRRGFTLVEILIVVVLLGILSALVIPQLASAGNETVKTHLARNLQAINTQIELYRARHAGQLPTDDPLDPLGEGLAKSGWGVLVSENYLREEPRNAYAATALLVAGTRAEAVVAMPADGVGWMYEVTEGDLRIHPAGYDPQTDTLAHEGDAG